MISDKIKHFHADFHADINDYHINRRSTRDSDHSSQVFSAKHQENERVEAGRFGTEMGIIITEQNMMKELLYCRVCLECEEEGNRLVKSCACRDQIHQKCLIEWIEHRAETSNHNSSLTCQICKGSYTVEIQSSFALTCEICKQKHQKYWRSFLQSLASFLLFLTVFVAGIVVMIKMQLDIDFSTELQVKMSLPKNTIVAVLVMVLVFFGSFTLGLSYKLFMEYCYGTKLKIKPSCPSNQAS